MVWALEIEHDNIRNQSYAVKEVTLEVRNCGSDEGLMVVFG